MKLYIRDPVESRIKNQAEKIETAVAISWKQNVQLQARYIPKSKG